MSTIVTLIVAVIILTLSIGLTYSVFCGAEEYAESVDSQSEQEIENLLAGGGKVQVADNSKRAERQGSAICGQDPVASAMFALGVKNIGDSTKVYDIQVERTYPPGTASEVSFFNNLEVGPREIGTTNILIQEPAGMDEEHVYKVTVTDASSGETYGIQQIYLEPE